MPGTPDMAHGKKYTKWDTYTTKELIEKTKESIEALDFIEKKGFMGLQFNDDKLEDPKKVLEIFKQILETANEEEPAKEFTAAFEKEIKILQEKVATKEQKEQKKFSP